MISKADAHKGRVLASACAIIEGPDHEVLFMYEGDMPYHKLWVLPGGYVKPNETIEQTVTREFEEETGLKIEATQLIGVYNDFLNEGGEPINHIIIAYRSEVVGGRIIFSREAIAYKWLPIKDALKESDIPEVFKKILMDFDKKRKKRFSLGQTT